MMDTHDDGTFTDENGTEYGDNDERAIFYARGVLETVKKLRWCPEVIHCQGWISALVPLYIKKSYMEWGRPDTIGVDFTGGTKVMSAAAAMAGAILNLEMVYVGSTEYLRDLRKPSPGSEILFRIDNPIVVFGDLEIEKAMSLFEEHNYSGVCEKLDPLLKQIPDEKVCEQLRYIIQIAQIYEQWDALFFVEASKKMNVLVMWLERACRNNGTVLMGDMLSALREQKEILKRLSTVPESIKENKNMNILKNKDVIFALMFTLLQSAMVREKQEKFDMATLLFYRLLEMMEQRRLALYELFVARPDYNKLIYNKSADRRYHGKSAELQEEELRKRVVEIRKELFGRANNYLQDPVSLLEGFILLYALKDEIVCSGRDGGIIRLKNIRQKVSLRNNSIFAHGLGPVEQGDYKRFRDFVVDMFKILCQIEGIDFMHYMTMMTWVNPAESRYYTLGVEN